MIHIDTVEQSDGTYSRAILLKRAEHPRATWEPAAAGRWMRSEIAALKSLLQAVMDSKEFFASTRFRYMDHSSPPDDFDSGDPKKRQKSAQESAS